MLRAYQIKRVRIETKIHFQIKCEYYCLLFERHVSLSVLSVYYSYK
jgi:hypothetical protein